MIKEVVSSVAKATCELPSQPHVQLYIDIPAAQPDVGVSDACL